MSFIFISRGILFIFIHASEKSSLEHRDASNFAWIAWASMFVDLVQVRKLAYDHDANASGVKPRSDMSGDLELGIGRPRTSFSHFCENMKLLLSLCTGFSFTRP